MQRARTASIFAGLARAAVLCALVLGLPVSSVRATDQEPPEMVPGMDLWTHQREAAPYWQSKDTVPEVSSRAERHRAFIEGGVPVEYRGHKSPYPAAGQVIAEGGRLYAAHCASCHGAKGLGNGDAGRDLTPSPALLKYMIARPRAVDEYLLWSISEGGARFGTAMPAYKDVLGEAQIWRIITYMRAGFPAVAESGQD